MNGLSTVSVPMFLRSVSFSLTKTIYSPHYSSQSAWLRNASIKGELPVSVTLSILTTDVIENILFNLPYVEERYRRTLEVCALVNDLKILEDSDESEIGERGVHVPFLLSAKRH